MQRWSGCFCGIGECGGVGGVVKAEKVAYSGGVGGHGSLCGIGRYRECGCVGGVAKAEKNAYSGGVGGHGSLRGIGWYGECGGVGGYGSLCGAVVADGAVTAFGL